LKKQEKHILNRIYYCQQVKTINFLINKNISHIFQEELAYKQHSTVRIVYSKQQS